MRTRRPHHCALTLAALLAAASHPAWAADYVWTGGSGNWFTGSNWSLGIAPNSSTADVWIDGSTSTDSSVTLLDSASIRNLSIGAGDELILARGSTLSIANGTGNTRWLLAGDVLLSGTGHTPRGGGYVGYYGFGKIKVVNQGTMLAEGVGLVFGGDS